MAVAASAMAVAVAVVVFLHASNELMVFDDDNILTADETLWGPAYGQQQMVYKLKRSLYKKPEFMVLGSSRVTQFRDVMAPGMSFYNATLAATNLDEALAFVRTLYPRHKPAVLLLGIDPWWFDPARGGVPEEAAEIEFSYRKLLSGMFGKGFRRRIVLSLFSGEMRYDADELGGRRPVGYLAALSGNGFRPDGSYQYGNILLDKNTFYDMARSGSRYGYEYLVNHVRSLKGRFSYVGEPADSQIATLRDFVDYHRRNGVEIILFFPPLAPTLYRAVQETPEQRAYFAKVDAAVRRLAAESGVPFFNFHDLTALGLGDEHALDGVHVDEIASLAVIRAMAAGSPALSRLFDDAAHERLLRLATHRDAWAGPHRLIP